MRWTPVTITAAAIAGITLWLLAAALLRPAIGRAWRRLTRNWRHAAAIIADEQARAAAQTPAPTPITQCGARDRMWMCVEAPGHLGDHAVYVDRQRVHRWPAQTPAPARPRVPEPGPGPGTPPDSPSMPGPAHHRGSHVVTDGWQCGCIYTWTRETGWVRDFDHLDAAIERMLRDQA